jgi:hypothetical protein
MLSFTNKPIVLNAVMLNVIILRVHILCGVAPM